MFDSSSFSSWRLIFLKTPLNQKVYAIQPFSNSLIRIAVSARYPAYKEPRISVDQWRQLTATLIYKLRTGQFNRFRVKALFHISDLSYIWIQKMAVASKRVISRRVKVFIIIKRQYPKSKLEVHKRSFELPRPCIQDNDSLLLSVV